MKDMIFYQAPDARTGDVIPKYIEIGRAHV